MERRYGNPGEELKERLTYELDTIHNMGSVSYTHLDVYKRQVFEAGNPLEKRRCPIDGDKVKSCIGCKTCAIMSGFGGAGAFSDGKYNITNAFGGTLYEHIGRKPAIDLMKYVDEINVSHGGEGTKMYSTAGSKFKNCLLYTSDLLRRRGGIDVLFGTEYAGRSARRCAAG